MVLSAYVTVSVAVLVAVPPLVVTRTRPVPAVLPEALSEGTRT